MQCWYMVCVSAVVGLAVVGLWGADFGRWRGVSRQSLPQLIPWEFRTMMVVAVQGAPTTNTPTAVTPCSLRFR
jgi:hypothetical protein